MEQNKYWKGHEELVNSPEFAKAKKKEFAEELPLLTEVKNVASEQKGNRRDFLKMLGFSLGAATVAASCEIPIKKVIPYVMKPEEIVPGIANYYASSFIDGSDYCSVLVKTREGRPIKIEGNDKSGITKGGTSSRAQASVISLYDGARLRYPKKAGQKATWATVDKDIVSKLNSARGSVVVLSSSIISPTTKKAIGEFTSKFGGKHVVFEPVSRSGMLTANEDSFGKKVIPAYHFDKANVIVSFGADFIGSWVSPVEFAADYTKGRKISKGHTKMSRHYQFESYMSLAGANADTRVSTKPSEEALAVVALYNEVAKAVGGSSVGGGVIKSDKLKKAIVKAALDLKQAKGKSLVISGSNDPAVQKVVNGINEMLGNYGSTIDLDHPYSGFAADDKAMSDLVSDMASGKVGALIVYNSNPAYSYYDSAKFSSALKKVGLTVSFNDREDETSEGITYLCPDSHYLESWNDAEPKKGFLSLGQPTISPLFDTRQAQESLLRWAGNSTSYYDYLRSNWKSSVYSKQSKASSFDMFWDAALHDGLFEVSNQDKLSIGTVYGSGKSMSVAAAPVVAHDSHDEHHSDGHDSHGHEDHGHDHDHAHDSHDDHAEDVVAAPVTVTGGTNVNAAASEIANKYGSSKGIELTLFESTNMGDGRFSNNPYLQEAPDPISKVTWDNVLAVSHKYAKEQGWNEYDVVEVSAGKHSVQLPVVFQPGQLYGTVSIAVGYGRTKSGNDHCNVGANVYPFVGFNGKSFDYQVSGVSINKVASAYALARTQTHHTIDDKRPIVREASIKEYKTYPWSGNDFSRKMQDEADHLFFTLYGKDPTYGAHTAQFKRGHHWGMSIDLTSCTGCNACVVACNVENNVPIVGKNEVFRAHEMHWLRIDRYYSSQDKKQFGSESDEYLEVLEHPDVTFMPMMCQHCDNAPCENVCPVAATNHSSEGLNQMAYNRCIGTRYCANNCPFKVRRFNWYDYQGADSFYKNTIFDNDEWAMVDDLSRMVLNPDVTVRSRGVMEKCSFCVQRLQDGKLEAKKEGRALKDGEVKTACQAACATGAIVFGDMNDTKSEVYASLKDERSYHLLEEIHVLPSVAYQVQLRNRDEDVAGKSKYKPKPKHHDDHHGGGHGHDDGHGHGHDSHGKKGHDDHGKGGHGKDDGHGH